jgi:hypothetical protein
MALTTALIKNQFAPGNTPKTENRQLSPYGQAVEMQRRALADLKNPKTKPSVRAALMRAWDVLEDRKRILRGIPLPGQLRPDLDPEQLLKALKRARERKPFELTAGKVTFTEGPAVEDEPAPKPITKSKLDTKAKAEVKLDNPEKDAQQASGDQKGISFDAEEGLGGVGGGGALGI